MALLTFGLKNRRYIFGERNLLGRVGTRFTGHRRDRKQAQRQNCRGACSEYPSKFSLETARSHARPPSSLSFRREWKISSVAIREPICCGVARGRLVTQDTANL